ncbi:MAG: putative aminohydrolase SsnA, partial [Elusimicrobiota bacterium]|nr:putative aminohydrolase SsnA [Elusimicrobiota bacterium]
MKKTILIKNAIIATGGNKNKILYDHSILISNDKIKRIAPKNKFKGKYTKTINAKGRIAMPGFINTHMHFYSTFARGLTKAKPSKDFVNILNNLWWRLDKKLTNEDSYYSALIPLIDSIKHGTTTLIDHHASPLNIKGSLFSIEKAVRKTGLRASLCYELSDRDGKKTIQEGLEENIEFIKYTKKKKDNFLHALFGLHASFTISDKTLEEAAYHGHKLATGFHIHAAEAQADQIYCEMRHKMRVLERLEKFGILGKKSIAAHCIHVNDNEIDILKRTGTAVVHNPQSNANNSVGVADIVKLINSKVLVGLGTDAMTVNMLEELRTAIWLQHLKNDPATGFLEPINALMINNAKIAKRYFKNIGSLKEENFA